MENATKALLIAAAILVAILIISLGLVVYNMAAETVQGINMSDQEIKAFNDKYLRYAGTNVSGTQVNALLNEAFSNNMGTDDVSKKVTVNVGTIPNASGNFNVTPTQTTSPDKVPTGTRFEVTLTYDSNTKLVNIITVNVRP